MNMRTVYYTREMLAAVKYYRDRNQRRAIFWIFLLIPLIMVVTGFSLSNPNTWVFLALMYAAEGFTYFITRPSTWKWLFRGRNEARPMQLTVNDEKVAVEEDGIRITLQVDNITTIAEIRGYLILQDAAGTFITLPKDQLLEDEVKLLDEVKSGL
ncbi:MAG: hypothetical protein QGH60_18315 [Phycisphaerae bacterium]|nr:hypothetical protein [Phycisphaerae bacterium]